MKELIGVVFLLLCVSVVVAEPVLTFDYDSYVSGETVLATLTVDGVFTRELEASDITFMEGRKSVFVEHEVMFYNSTHYLVMYPNRAGEFTMTINNVLYKTGDVLAAKTLTVPFVVNASLVEGNVSVKKALGIRPGVYKALSLPTVKLTNKGEVELSLTVLGEEVVLQPLQNHVVEVVPEEEFSFLTVSSYKEFRVPLVYLGFNDSHYVAPLTPALVSLDSLFFANVVLEDDMVHELRLDNPGAGIITNVSVVASEDFVVANVSSFPADEQSNVSFVITPSSPGHYTGTINISYTQYEKQGFLQVPFSFFVIPQGGNESSFEKVGVSSCADIGGNVCGTLTCAGDAVFTEANEYCCLAECVEVDLHQSSGVDSASKWVLGVAILLALGLLAYYFYKKSKHVEKKEKGDDPLEKSVERFASRMEQKPKPAHKGLQRS